MSRRDCYRIKCHHACSQRVLFERCRRLRVRRIRLGHGARASRGEDQEKVLRVGGDAENLQTGEVKLQFATFVRP